MPATTAEAAYIVCAVQAFPTNFLKFFALIKIRTLASQGEGATFVATYLLFRRAGKYRLIQRPLSAPDDLRY